MLTCTMETSKLFGTGKISLKFSVNVISLAISSKLLINILFMVKDEINYKEDLEAKIEFHQTTIQCSYWTIKSNDNWTIFSKSGGNLGAIG